MSQIVGSAQEQMEWSYLTSPDDLVCRPHSGSENSLRTPSIAHLSVRASPICFCIHYPILYVTRPLATGTSEAVVTSTSK